MSAEESRSFTCDLDGLGRGSPLLSHPAFCSRAGCLVRTAASRDSDLFVKPRCSSQADACSLISASSQPLNGRRILRSTLAIADWPRPSHPTWTVTLSSVVSNRVYSVFLRPPRLKMAILDGYARCSCCSQHPSRETFHRHWAAASTEKSCRGYG